MKKILLYIAGGIVALLFIIGALSPEPEEKAIQNSSTGVPDTSLIDNQELTSADTSIESAKVQAENTYSVVKVVDGDTLDVSIDGKVERLRLIGIDTPETVDPRKPVQCFGVEASNKAKSVLTGKKVSLEADNTQGERDKYDRLLRYVFLEDGTNFNQLMIEQGYAHEYTYDVPYMYQQQFKLAQINAKLGAKGFWSPDTCNGSPTIPLPSGLNSNTSEPKTTTTTSTSSQCNSNYSGCLKKNAGDYDCAGGSGNGPNYTGVVQVLGYDEYGLDRDGDGLACESS
jgi:micrococcal nuclease